MDGDLILEDKTVFKGQFFGYPKETSGEVVFTTGMVGYPESLTDPSFKGQILVFTYPLMGNYGVPKPRFKNGLIQNFESEKIQVKGVIVTYHSDSISHWQARLSLANWLRKNKIPGLFGIDTRFLTQKLRQKGTMLGKILKKSQKGKGKIPSKSKGQKFYDPNKENLIKRVSCKQVKIYRGGRKKVLLIDCGTKMNIIRSLLRLKTTVIQVPWDFDPLENAVNFDGVVVSNGPGDPKKAKPTIKIVRKILAQNIPFLGICLGNQILALAAGGKTYKLKYGHRSQNQPCLLKDTQKAFVTSQNHGFAVKTDSLPSDWQEWFVNLNDGTNEGIIHKRKPFASIQFHPEASPGPTDTKFIFEDFLSWIK